MSLVRLTHDLIVNPEHVSSVSWDRSFGARLVVTMQDGKEHSIKHAAGYDGVDCYEIERKLLAMCGEAKP